MLWHKEKIKGQTLNNEPIDNEKDYQLLLSDYRIYINLCKTLDDDISNLSEDEVVKSHDYWIVSDILKTVSGNTMIKAVNTSHVNNNNTKRSHELFNAITYISIDDINGSIFLKKL